MELEEIMAILIGEMIEQDPYALILNCDQIELWQELTQHVPPQSVIDKLDNLDNNYTSIISGDWNIQYIENAQGPVVNMDYFSVKISQFPINPTTGQRFTPQGFYDYVRSNINTFFEGNSTEFGPYNSTESTVWSSSNYLGAIMRFDIALEIEGIVIGQQDGSVICSENNSMSWTFTTIESPMDWNHPVSGNRQFGLNYNSDGTYTFYTRGVDRIAESFDNWVGGINAIPSAFDGADALWTTFQNNLGSFINSSANQGQASIQNPQIDRVDWDLVKDVLQGNKPISDLGCD
jgi:hypothetical protein